MLLPICIALVAFQGAPSGPVLSGTPFLPDTVPVVWEAPTNSLPSSIWVYRVLPQEFSPAVVSNLMGMGGFTRKDRTYPEGERPFKDKRMLYFANKDRTCHLGIFAPLGWIEYVNENARAAAREPVRGVPSEEQALNLALKFLEKCGISARELAPKPDGSGPRVIRDVRERNRFDREKGEWVKEVLSRGVGFVRQVDGIPFTGLADAGGFRVVFGNDARIAELELVWRKLARHETRVVCSSAEIVERVTKGAAVLISPPLRTPKRIKRLTVTKATPFYMGEGGDTQQEFVLPFLALECTAELDDGSKAALVLNCPMAR